MPTKRGCGYRKEGAFYLGGRAGRPGGVGVASPIEWALGTGLIGGKNCFVESKPRGQILNVNIPATLLTGYGPVYKWEPLEFSGDDAVWYNVLKDRVVGVNALQDHIGHEHYTPLSFYIEAKKYTASFRVSPRDVPSILEATRGQWFVPVLCTQRLPVFDSLEQMQSVMLDTELPSLRQTVPTWYQEHFGHFDVSNQIEVDDQSYFYFLLELQKCGWRVMQKRLDAGRIPCNEQPFAVALTHGVQYTGVGMEEKDIDPLALSKGVTMVYADEETQREIDFARQRLEEAQGNRSHEDRRQDRD